MTGGVLVVLLVMLIAMFIEIWPTIDFILTVVIIGGFIIGLIVFLYILFKK